MKLWKKKRKFPTAPSPAAGGGGAGDVLEAVVWIAWAIGEAVGK